MTKSSLSLPATLIAILVIIALAASLFGSPALERTVAEVLIRLVLVVGLYIFVGNSGVISFGHTAFMCIGAYGAAWLTVPPMMKGLFLPGLPDFILHNTIPVFPAALLSGLLAMLVALVTGILIMRLSGIAASIATFAFLAIVNVIYSNWESVTAATSSVVGIPTYANVWVTLAWASAAILIAWLYGNSRYGLALRATREDEVAAQAAGINVRLQRLIAYVLSAFVVGISGVLQAHFLGVINPGAFYLGVTFISLAMLVVGGINSLSGAVIGVLFISGVIELLVTLEDGVSIANTNLSLPSGVQEIAVGVLMVLILIFRPSGLTGGREISPTSWFRFKRNKIHQ